MKKYTGIIVGVLVVLAFVLYYFLSGQNTATVAGLPPAPAGGVADAGATAGQGSPAAGTPAAGSPPAPVPAPAPAPAPAPTPTQVPTPTPSPAAGAYKDGTYTGPVTDAIYGQLQVVATIKGGKLANISYPVYPNGNGHTQEVSGFALPQLKQEAIASQSANVDIVSGATQTSQAYQLSLAAALAQAKN